ncbi:hypothetical protein QQF64_024004 [Cirrhinus molitorella]|uniref:Uncharacterized protein n=1 Tax=Cirrhinus molitorella TaxID=172907 RepID=A0ABR3NK19_9TELE
MTLKSQCSSISSVSSDLESGLGLPQSIAQRSPQLSPTAFPPLKAVSTEQVEISPGSNVFIDRLAWAVAQIANSASCVVRTLLTAVFPVDVLLVSNLRGTSRDSVPQRQALDKKKKWMLSTEQRCRSGLMWCPPALVQPSMQNLLKLEERRKQKNIQKP